MSEETFTRQTSGSVETDIALIRQQLDIVVGQHEKQLAGHETLHSSAHSKISVLELQTNTHAVQIADLRTRVLGSFGKWTVGVSVFIAGASLLLNWSTA